MERMYVMKHIGENNTTLQGQRKSIFQTVWNRCIGNFSRRPTIFSSKIDNSLSTLLNNEIITPEYIKKSYVQEEKSVDINHMSNIIFETMQSMPPITVDSFNKSHLKTLSNCKHYFGNNFDKIKEHYQETTIDVYNLDSNITCENKKSTMESHSVSNIHEIENLNNISNNSCPIEVALQKCIDTDKDGLDKDPLSNNDINEDTKSFLIVSHSDVPEPTKKAPISTRLSFMCRNAWNSLTTRFYCRTNSVKSEKSMKRPSYLSKRFRRRKANSIAMGRGRGRDRCQLRRSGVSQTRHRMERTKRDLAMIIEVDYKIYQNDKIQYCELQNDHSSNDESNNLDDMDGYDVPDGALLLKRTSPVIFSSSDITLTKQEPQMSQDQETVKHSTKVRYVIDSSTKSNKDCNKKTSDMEESLSRSRLLSVSSIDSEDSFIVFEANDDESSRQQYSTEIHYTHDSSMRTNENCNSEIYDTHSNLSRSRLLSESSVDSEDSFIIFKDIENESPKKQETMKCLTKVRYIIDPLTKINNSYYKDCDETYNTLRSRLCSESSSADSEDSLIIFEGSDDDESSKQETTEDSTDIYDESDSSTVNNDHCKDYNNKKYMHEDSFQCSENSDTEDSFCIVFNTELEENCVEEETDNFNYIKTSTPTFKKDESMIESDEDSEKSTTTTQTKKVSFAQTPIIHIMVTWNYAYRAARKGQWEEMARDNERFKGRINSIAAVLDPILTSKHRSKIWQERFSSQE